MMINRRDFLKGLAALTGAAIVPFDSNVNLPVPAEVSPIAIPTSDGYWAQIDGAWYVLRDASVEVIQDVAPMSFDGLFMENIPTARTWHMTLDLIPDNSIVPVLMSYAPIDIKLLTPYGTFTGSGYINGSQPIIDAWGLDFYQVTITGIRELECVRGAQAANGAAGARAAAALGPIAAR